MSRLHEQAGRVQRKRDVAMDAAGKRQLKPELKQLVREASDALARLDAERLEELARCCKALNRDWDKARSSKHAPQEQTEMARQAREAAGEFLVFTRVLQATRANLDVMTRLHALREEPLEY
jgi:hypothetical protein